MFISLQRKMGKSSLQKRLKNTIKQKQNTLRTRRTRKKESKNYSPFIRKYKGFMIKYIGLFIEKRQSTALGECCTSDLRLFFMKGRPPAREDWTRRIDRLS